MEDTALGRTVTVCSDMGHIETLILKEILRGPLGQIYELVSTDDAHVRWTKVLWYRVN